MNQLYVFYDGWSWKVSEMVYENGAYWFQTHFAKVKVSSVKYHKVSEITVKHILLGGVGIVKSVMYDDGLDYGIYWTKCANTAKYPNHYYWNSCLKIDVIKFKTR